MRGLNFGHDWQPLSSPLPFNAAALLSHSGREQSPRAAANAAAAEVAAAGIGCQAAHVDVIGAAERDQGDGCSVPGRTDRTNHTSGWYR